MFKDFFYKVSQFAIGKIVDQLNINTTLPCFGLFYGSYGIPCVHQLRNILNESSFIPISVVDKQWYLKKVQLL